MAYIVGDRPTPASGLGPHSDGALRDTGSRLLPFKPNNSHARRALCTYDENIMNTLHCKHITNTLLDTHMINV